METQSHGSSVHVSRRLIERLASLALPEAWAYGGDELGLLERYLSCTFARVFEQGKISVASDGKGTFAALATGLVDGSFEDLYCVCEPDGHGVAQTCWETKAFCAMGRTRYGKRLARACGEDAPLRATYFEDEPMVKAGRRIEVDYSALAAQSNKLTHEARMEIDVADEALFGEALHVAVEVMQARLRYVPQCALPGWGPAIGLDGLVLCAPLSFSDPARVDAALVLESAYNEGRLDAPYCARKMLSVEEAWLATRVVRVPDGGMGWGVAKHAAIPAEVAMPAEQTWKPEDARARLTCKNAAVPPFVVRSGDTVGILRRRTAERARIVLPSLHGFEGVSQIQGRFEARREDVWEYVHEGSNWTLIRHTDGTDRVLRERGAREQLGYGDILVFSGSPSFVLGR